MTEMQIFGVVVRGLGVWFAALGMQEMWRVLLLAFSKYANERGNYPVLQTLSVALIWFALSYVLIRRPEVVVELAYRPKGEPEHSPD